MTFCHQGLFNPQLVFTIIFFLQSRIKIQCPNLNIYIYIYSNPRLKNKNDHDNPDAFFASYCNPWAANVLDGSYIVLDINLKSAPKKELSSNGLCGELIQFVKGKETLQQKKCILGKIQWPKITFGAKCNGESVEVSAKYIQNKRILGKIQWKQIAFGVRYNGEKLKNLGKIHRKTIFFGKV